MFATAKLLGDLTVQTERHLQKSIAEWQLLAPNLLATQPAPNSWSAAQCLEHLNFYGKFYIPAMQKAIQNAQKQGSKPAENFKSGWLGRRFSKMMMPGNDGKVISKMNAPKNAIPSKNPDPVVMLAEFIEQREHLNRLIIEAADVNLNEVRVPISIAPWLRLRLGDVLIFMTAHDYRHILQADRAILGEKAVPFGFII